MKVAVWIDKANGEIKLRSAELFLYINNPPDFIFDLPVEPCKEKAKMDAANLSTARIVIAQRENEIESLKKQVEELKKEIAHRENAFDALYDTMVYWRNKALEAEKKLESKEKVESKKECVASAHSNPSVREVAALLFADPHNYLPMIYITPYGNILVLRQDGEQEFIKSRTEWKNTTPTKDAVDVGEGHSCVVCAKRYCSCPQRQADKSWKETKKTVTEEIHCDKINFWGIMPLLAGIPLDAKNTRIVYEVDE